MVCLRHFFNSAFTLVPIQFLRLPDRWVPAKPWQTERMNPFFRRRINTDADTFIAVSRPETTGETITGGTDESVPYERLLAAVES